MRDTLTAHPTHPPCIYNSSCNTCVMHYCVYITNDTSPTHFQHIHNALHAPHRQCLAHTSHTMCRPCIYNLSLHLRCFSNPSRRTCVMPCMYIAHNISSMHLQPVTTSPLYLQYMSHHTRNTLQIHRRCISNPSRSTPTPMHLQPVTTYPLYFQSISQHMHNALQIQCTQCIRHAFITCHNISVVFPIHIAAHA